MDRGASADRQCKWQSIPDSKCESHDLYARCEEGSMPSQTPGAGIQQKPKTTSSKKKVFQEPEPSQKSLSDNIVPKAQAVQPKWSRRPVDRAHWSGVNALDHHVNIEVADKGVNGKRSNHYGDRKDNIPLLQCAVEDGEDTDVTFSCLSGWEKFMKVWHKLCYNLKKLRDAIFNRRVVVREKATGRGLKCCLYDVQDNLFQRLLLGILTHSKAVSKKTCKAFGQRDALLRSQGSSGKALFTAVIFSIENEVLQCSGYDLQLGAWRTFLPISCLPKPDTNLFKEYAVCGHGGLMVANVSKLPDKEELVVFNLLTNERKTLPSLHYLRNPVLLHIKVDFVTDSYVVIAGGSSSSSDEEHLSRRMEVYDSRTSKWKVASDIPGPEYGLNEHQAGVCANGILYFIAFLDCYGQKGIVAFDVMKGAWLKDRTCSVPYSSHSHVLQLVESYGTVYLYSQQGRGNVVEDCIDVLEFCTFNGEGAWRLRNVISVEKSGGRGLLVFPEYTCVPHGKGKLCVFNTINRDGVVYDMENGVQSDILLPPPPESLRGENFYCLNPVSFTLEPNFASKP